MPTDASHLPSEPASQPKPASQALCMKRGCAAPAAAALCNVLTDFQHEGDKTLQSPQRQLALLAFNISQAGVGHVGQS
jgi:hypothetical protein